MLLYDDSLLEKVPLVTSADDKDEARPLPVKMHIDATIL